MKYVKAIILTLMIGLSSQSLAQDFFDEPPPMDGPKREQIEERIKTVMIWKLTEELDLSSEQSQAFFPIYNKFHEDRRDLEENRRNLLKELKDLTQQEKPESKEILTLLDKIDAFEKQVQDLRAKFRNDVKDILTTQQIGRLYVFEVSFMHQIREIIMDARQETHGRGPQGPR